MAKLLMTFSTLCAFLLSSANLPAEDTIKDSMTGTIFPKTVTIDYQGKNYSLEATGVATRTKLIVKVYSMAHYMEPLNNGKAKADIFEQILDSKKAKQITIVWLRNVEREKIVGGYHESFEKVLGHDLPSLQQQIDQFLSFIGNVRTNDRQEIRWLPDGSVEVYIQNEKQGTVKDPKFARALWSIWFGKNSVVKRENLVSFIK